VEPIRITKKRVGKHYAKLVFLHPVGSVGLVVHSSAVGPHNLDALLFMLWWARCCFHKKRVQTRSTELVFCIWWDLRVKYCILLRPGQENVDALFFMLGWERYGFHK
jgi:hypothetical protein